MNDQNTKFEMWVHIGRPISGVTIDAGLHRTFSTREEAEIIAPEEAAWLSCGGTKVVKWNIKEVKARV